MTTQAKTSAAVDTIERHLSPKELAERHGVPVSTVYHWRTYNKGPRALRVGKHLRYRIEDVLAWEESQLDPRESA